jgi:hypothetical protein
VCVAIAASLAWFEAIYVMCYYCEATEGYEEDN